MLYLLQIPRCVGHALQKLSLLKKKIRLSYAHKLELMRTVPAKKRK